jgi:hypothetical protein
VWDTIPGFNKRVDPGCVEYIDPAGGRPLQTGDRVRLAREWTYDGGRPALAASRARIPVGSEGVITGPSNGGPGMWAVRFDAWQDDRKRVDAECLERVETPATEPAREWQVGDRVELITEHVMLRGDVRSRERERGNLRHIATRGDQGTITTVDCDAPGDIVEVRWDGFGPARYADRSCIRHVREFQIGDRVVLTGEYTNNGQPRRDVNVPVGGQGVVDSTPTNGIGDVPDGMVQVRWDNGAGQRFIDVNQIRLATNEIVVGGRVRLTSRFTYAGRTSPDWDRRFGEVGDEGVVDAIEGDVIRAYWPHGADPTFRSNVDRSCLEAI